MLKIYCAVLAIVVSALSYSQPTTVLFEDFEGSFPAGWSTINNDGLVPDPNVSFVNDAWVVSADLDDPSGPDSVITSTSWYDPIGTSDDWLISPAFTLGAFGNKLKFKASSSPVTLLK